MFFRDFVRTNGGCLTLFWRNWGAVTPARPGDLGRWFVSNPWRLTTSVQERRPSLARIPETCSIRAARENDLLTNALGLGCHAATARI
ncbi:Os03g0697466 [Oryza sativa Japonica Group]|uniref:Os03g0697466 protein n=1 Tax=Oryza sativa subsp. japonica TaxID=39947 RepID=A0A0P0W2E9_ORYSJ|nr:hypothetical protein EE612_019848 [Oryza sativa]BAS85892.1 Os03g0697466 [Oryza sativa Japonica Group]